MTFSDVILVALVFCAVCVVEDLVERVVDYWLKPMAE